MPATVFHFWDGNVNRFLPTPSSSPSSDDIAWFGDVYVNGLMAVPVEMVLHIVEFLHPRDVGSLTQTCKAVNSLCSSNYVWKSIHEAIHKDITSTTMTLVEAAVEPKEDQEKEEPRAKELHEGWTANRLEDHVCARGPLERK
jgi:hypothetical protein